MTRRYITIGDEFGNPTSHGGMGSKDSRVMAPGPNWSKKLPANMSWGALEMEARKQLAWSGADVRGETRRYDSHGVAIAPRQDKTRRTK